MTLLIDPVHRLKLSSALCAIFWTVGMIWWSGDYSTVNIGIFTLCGALFGVLWFFAMRWYSRRAGHFPKA